MLSDQQLLELAALTQGRSRGKVLPPLLEWMPQVSKNLLAPRWLSPIATRVAATLVEHVEFCFSVPPRHGKTTLTWHAVAWLLLQRPTMRILFAASEQKRAEREMSRAKALFVRSGGQLGKTNTQEYWETSAGGYVRSAGLNGPIVGDGFHVVFVDDPHRGRAEAESKTTREAVVTRFTDDVYTRREPAIGDFKGTSFIVVHTRWHIDDLIGNLTRSGEWAIPFEYINLPYEDGVGRVLAPEIWPPETMVNYRRNRRNWESVFLGRPTPAGGSVFEGTHLYEPSKMPTGLRYAIGLDLAYSAKKSADFSVAVVAAKGSDGRVYVVDVVREQSRPREFAQRLKRLEQRYPGAPMRWYTGGQEEAAADLLRELGVARLMTLSATVEKRVRALPVSDAWNEGRVLIPGSDGAQDPPEWTGDFANEVLAFTGQGDAHDDQVDALAAAFDALEHGGMALVPSRPHTPAAQRPTYRNRHNVW